MNKLVDCDIPNRYVSTYKFPDPDSFKDMVSTLRGYRATLNKLVSEVEQLPVDIELTYNDVVYVCQHLNRFYCTTCDLLALFTDAQASIIFGDKF